MPQGPGTSINVDLTRIDNAETRRAVRSLMQQMQAVIDRQQIEIEALLEMMLDKHIGSLGEFRLYVQKIAQHATERAERVHTQLAQVVPPVAPRREETRKPAPVPPDEDEHRVYRL